MTSSSPPSPPKSVYVFFVFIWFELSCLLLAFEKRKKRKWGLGREMHTAKLIEIASDWPPYLVISPFSPFLYQKDRIVEKIAFIYFSPSFLFLLLLLSFPYLKRKKNMKNSRVQQSKMSCGVIGSRSNANVSLISPFCAYFFPRLLFFWNKSLDSLSLWSAGRDWNWNGVKEDDDEEGEQRNSWMRHGIASFFPPFYSAICLQRLVKVVLKSPELLRTPLYLSSYKFPISSSAGVQVGYLIGYKPLEILVVKHLTKYGRVWGTIVASR